MSDLISRSELIKELNKYCGSQRYLVSENIREIINNQPTYDIDKVVEELKKHKDTTDLNTVDEEMVVGFTVYQGAFNDAIDKAIEVVKQGIASDDVCEWKGKEKEYIQNPHTKRLYSNEESVKNCYCNTCGKRINVEE